MKEQTIRAVYDNDTIIVYQAFNKNIAESAVNNQTFISPPFKKERMTWIKPSFLWMMYRSGWATKENQENILAIKIKRSGLSFPSYDPYASSSENKFLLQHIIICYTYRYRCNYFGYYIARAYVLRDHKYSRCIQQEVAGPYQYIFNELPLYFPFCGIKCPQSADHEI